MSIIRGNISNMVRQIDLEKKAVLRQIGDALAANLWEDFIRLLYETPQWTGSTAASWRIGMEYRVGKMASGGVVKMPERTRQEALEMGHEAAVAIAVKNNIGALADISTRYMTSDIVVWNDSDPGARVIETGPLRAVNGSPGEAFAKFKARVETSNTTLIQSRKNL